MNHNIDHAKRALILSSKGAFVVLVSAVALDSGNFDPSAVAAVSFLGTVLAGATIEAVGRSWIKNRRIAADIPNRGWRGVIIDGVVAGAAAGASTSVAPRAEEAAVRLLQIITKIPQEMAMTEVEMMSIQNVVYNAPGLAREIARAAASELVRVTPSGLQMLTARNSQPEALSGVQSPTIIPGRYYFANAQTGYLLQLCSPERDDQLWLRASRPHFKDTQVCVVEQGKVGLTIRSSAFHEYVGYHDTEIQLGALCLTGPENATEFRVEGSYEDGFSFFVVDGPNPGLVLDLEHDDILAIDEVLVNLGASSESLRQRWLLEEDCHPNLLELYRGPVPIGVTMHIYDVVRNISLKIGPPGGNSRFVRLFSDKPSPATRWMLEAGFKGYRLKRVSSGLYALAGRTDQAIKVLPLTLGHAETEFLLNGDDQNGYSIVHALNPSYGLGLDEATHGDRPQTVLMWKPDANHSRWRFETLA